MSLSLIGPRGAGKSAIGRRLAGQLTLTYESIDERIAAAAGRSIAEIVAAEGWVKFRVLEEAALAEVASKPNRLLDCGGGIVEVPGNRKRLREAGPVVWVTAPIAVLVERIRGDAERPPLTDEGDPFAEMEDVVARRDPLYRETADLTVHNAGEDVESICEEIIAWIRALSA